MSLTGCSEVLGVKKRSSQKLIAKGSLHCVEILELPKYVMCVMEWGSTWVAYVYVTPPIYAVIKTTFFLK